MNKVTIFNNLLLIFAAFLLIFIGSFPTYEFSQYFEVKKNK